MAKNGEIPVISEAVNRVMEAIDRLHVQDARGDLCMDTMYTVRVTHYGDVSVVYVHRAGYVPHDDDVYTMQGSPGVEGDYATNHLPLTYDTVDTPDSTYLDTSRGGYIRRADYDPDTHGEILSGCEIGHEWEHNDCRTYDYDGLKEELTDIITPRMEPHFLLAHQYNQQQQSRMQKTPIDGTN